MITAGDALSGITRLGIDTAPIIYFIESHLDFDSRVTPFFQAIEAGEITGVTSAISVTEVLTLPLRMGNTQLYLQYRDLLTRSQHLEVLPVDVPIAERASILRAQYGLRTPDALQIAAAAESGCEAFLTNDAHLRCVDVIRVIMLGEIVP